MAGITARTLISADMTIILVKQLLHLSHMNNPQNFDH